MKRTIFILYVLFSACNANNDNIHVDKSQIDLRKNKEKMNYFELEQNGETYKILLLNSEAKENIISKAFELKNAYYNEAGIRVYKLSTEEVLVVRDGEREYPLYPSEKILITQLTKFNGPKTEDLLEGINPYDDKFPSISKDIINNFLVEFNIVPKDKSNIQLLEEINKTVIKNRNKVFFKKHYLSFIALIGSMINNEFSSEWLMKKNNNTWDPYIEYKGRQIFFAHYIELDFFDLKISNPLLNSYESLKSVLEYNN